MVHILDHIILAILYSEALKPLDYYSVHVTTTASLKILFLYF